VIDTIPLEDPQSSGLVDSRTLEFNPNNNNLYVANFNLQNISVISSNTNTVIDTIPVGNYPREIIFNPSNNNIYVANLNSNTVSVIDTTTNTVIDTIDVGISPDAMDLNPHSHKLYTTDYNSNTVSVIDTTTNTVIDTIFIGNNPDAIAINPINNNVYVANHRSNTISVIGPSTTEPPQPPEEEAPRTIGDLIRGMIQNPLDITNSIDSANQIRDILTDNDRDNDHLVCDLIDSDNEFTSNIREILNC
jgi:YVTN family beta-propeller protein